MMMMMTVNQSVTCDLVTCFGLVSCLATAVDWVVKVENEFERREQSARFDWWNDSER